MTGNLHGVFGSCEHILNLQKRVTGNVIIHNFDLPMIFVVIYSTSSQCAFKKKFNQAVELGQESAVA